MASVEALSSVLCVHTLYCETYECNTPIKAIVQCYPLQHWCLPKQKHDVIKWKHFPRYWPLVRVPGEFPTQRPATRSFDVFFDLHLNKRWVNNREAGDLRRYRAHYDVTIMNMHGFSFCLWKYGFPLHVDPHYVRHVAFLLSSNTLSANYSPLWWTYTSISINNLTRFGKHLSDDCQITNNIIALISV